MPARCPVRRECLADALRYEDGRDNSLTGRWDAVGIWGDLTPSEHHDKRIRHLPDCERSRCAGCRPLEETLDALERSFGGKPPLVDSLGDNHLSAQRLEVEADPHTDSPASINIANFDFELPDDWRRRMKPGANFKVELVLHPDAIAEAKAGPRWRAKWLELTRLTG